MIPVFFGIVISGVFSVWYWLSTDTFYRKSRVDTEPIGYVAFCVILWVIVGAVIGLVVAFIINVVVSSENQTYCSDEVDTPLVALNDSHATQGSFFLGSGLVDSKLTYFYFTRKNGAIRSGSIETSTVVIFEDQSDHPYQATFTGHINPAWNLWTLGIAGDCETDFHVPPDSVDKGYKVG